MYKVWCWGRFQGLGLRVWDCLGSIGLRVWQCLGFRVGLGLRVWECLGFVGVQDLGLGGVQGSGFRSLVVFQGLGLRSV